jgi:phospholipid-transporting ATPase
VLFLACCHTIIIDQKTKKYNSSSPDELALVNAAKQFGYEFKERDGNNNVTIYDKKQNQSYIYHLLNVCEFTSSRKRMSVIYRDPWNRIILMCKGADSVITENLIEWSRQSSLFVRTEQYVNAYAAEGLRTLYLAEKFLT